MLRPSGRVSFGDCMKVKLLISRAGCGFSQGIGDIVDVGDDEALRLVEKNHAAFIDQDEDGDVDRYDVAMSLGIEIYDDEGNKLHWRKIDKLIAEKQA
jgi:hypothetical protein